MTIDEMLESIVAGKKDPLIPDYDRLRKYYEVATSGGGCGPCKMRRVKRAIRLDLEGLLKPKT